MNTTKFELNSIEQLPQAAQWLHQQITQSGRTIIELHATMGAGKTTLVGEYCKSILGVGDTTTSPTFAIVNQYTASSGSPVYHFDCYRFESEEEAHQIGIFEYLDSANICLIEWPEKIEKILQKCDTLKIKITVSENGAKRVLEVL